MDPKIPIPKDVDDADWQRLQDALKEEDAWSQMVEALGPHFIRVCLVGVLLGLCGLCSWIYWYIVVVQGFRLPPGW